MHNFLGCSLVPFSIHPFSNPPYRTLRRLSPAIHSLYLTEPTVPIPSLPPILMYRHRTSPCCLAPTGPLASRSFLHAVIVYYLCFFPCTRSLPFLSCMNLCCNTMGSTTTPLYSAFGLTLLLDFVINDHGISFWCSAVVSRLSPFCSLFGYRNESKL